MVFSPKKTTLLSSSWRMLLSGRNKRATLLSWWEQGNLSCYRLDLLKYRPEAKACVSRDHFPNKLPTPSKEVGIVKEKKKNAWRLHYLSGLLLWAARDPCWFRGACRICNFLQREQKSSGVFIHQLPFVTGWRLSQWHYTSAFLGCSAHV